MNLYGNQKTRSFIDLGPRSLRFTTFSDFFSLENARPIEARFHMKPPWDERTKACSNGPGHLTNMAAMLIYGKNLKEPSSVEPKWPMILKVGMQHLVLEYCQVCSNDDP